MQSFAHRNWIPVLLGVAIGAAFMRTGGLSADARAQDLAAARNAAVRAISTSTLAHCEIPCGLYDDYTMIQQMRLDAATIAKASVQIGLLSEKTDAEHLNTLTRWVMVKEEYSRNLQHMNAWYFLTQRVKAVGPDSPLYKSYIERLTAHHAISVAAMKAAQSLDPKASAKLVAAIDAVSGWYAPKTAGFDASDSENWTKLAGRTSREDG